MTGYNLCSFSVYFGQLSVTDSHLLGRYLKKLPLGCTVRRLFLDVVSQRPSPQQTVAEVLWYMGELSKQDSKHQSTHCEMFVA